MTNQPPYPGAPRWVKILGVVAVVAVGLFVAFHIATGGLAHFVDHGRHAPANTP